MFSKLLSSLAVLSLMVAVPAVPTIQAVPRHNGFVFAVATVHPVSASSTAEPEVDKTTVTPSLTPEPAYSIVMETSPSVPIDEPMVTSKSDSFAYNIGGRAVGDFMADPENWAIGETATFEISDARIEGAPDKYADIYKSHRYGLVGSTWGYDIAVDTPGVYDCTLHYSETFSEFFTAEPNRTFKVEISGDASEEVQEAEFDVMVELAGAEFTPYTRTFQGIVVAKTLKIRETPSSGDAFLSGISCTYISPVATN